MIKTRIEIMLLDIERFFKYWLMYTIALVIWILSIIMIATIILVPLWLTLREESEWFKTPIKTARDSAFRFYIK